MSRRRQVEPVDHPVSKTDQQDESQVERFRRVAQELGVDEDEDRFREKLRVIARQKPKDEVKQTAPKLPSNSRKRTVAR